MTIPVSVDWTPTYLARLPRKGEWGAGTCTDLAVIYAMELCAILTGQPVVQLSQLFLQWCQYPYPGHGQGGSGGGAAGIAQSQGVCAEALWPISMVFGPDTERTGITDYEKQITVMNTPPTAACYADAPNYKILEWEAIVYNKPGGGYYTQAEMIQRYKESIAAGYPLIMYQPSRNHELVGWAYDATGVGGLDPTSPSNAPFHLSWDEVGVEFAVKSVRFLQGGPYSTIPPQGVTNMTLAADSITIWNAIQAANGVANQTQKDQIIALAAQISVTATPPPPSGSTWQVPPSASGTDAQGQVWSLGTTTAAGKQVLRDGSWFASGQATLLDYRNGVLKVQNNQGTWWTPSGNGWVSTSAP